MLHDSVTSHSNDAKLKCSQKRGQKKRLFEGSRVNDNALCKQVHIEAFCGV